MKQWKIGRHSQRRHRLYNEGNAVWPTEAAGPTETCHGSRTDFLCRDGKASSHCE